MAGKVKKISRSKGERLGWTPLDKVNHITLSSVVVKGRRIVAHSASDTLSDENFGGKFLIP
ncbi:MAG TPA: hypothetical protein VIM55_19440 [Mucilaginibacter sp.]